ncbi:M20/M25/M40 family metallo-hydrolase [Ralstonia sp. CHL-2022]|jgi:glutamate carboxypeptidase|uniref:M20/M25/M40 family metallo-hydrolase n=1 Tax=Ralstonia mojiangensis TaxID=2953895 RepID=A0ABT2L9G4_9RALS|nr:M20/M25/M40 family metallo-hydrolase [Ralstonia mojiangensis]MCT7298788.1 M20/M25/M40 family metallo-hydrolase [Ralstonia mojiangensis]MCT7311567.1 M20/M25/M40 family metallo-hydrolase [Ralstonia mojiangensis]
MKPSRLAVAALLLCASGLSCAADANPKVLSAAEGYRGDALHLLERLVNIDSGTGNEAGLSQMGSIVTDELRKAGAHVETVSAAPAVGNNILATWKGTGKKRILLMAHMDTVFKDGTARAKPFTIKDKRAYGPGVMDDKGGVVAGLYAMKILQQLDFKQYGQVTLLLNTNEETGSKGTRALIEREAKQHDVTLNLEPGRPADGLVVWRKGSGTAEIDIKGKAAHAGVAPESGRNAANELAHQVLQLGKLGDSAKQTTFNVTVLKAGDATNVIPDHATAYADVRVAVPEEFDRVERDLTRVSANKLIPDTEVKTSLVRGFPPMPRNAASDELAAKAQAIYGEIGRKLTLEGSGGAADSSLSAGVGTPTLDGFGIVGGGIHTPEEYAEVESVVPRLYLLSRMIMELAANK